MYDVSEQFHTAVYDTSPVTRALFRFTDGTIFTNEDIHSSGLKIMEAANYEEELTIGTCLSSTLTATFMNYSGLLSGFAFGECDVALGVKIGTDTFVPAIANTIAVSDAGVMYTGHSTAPYLKADGVATAEQPDFAVHSIVIYDGEVMCIGSDGQTWTTAAWTGTVNTGAFMTQKYVKMASSQLGYDFTDDVLRVYSNQGLVEIFEYAKLGTFIINTPKKRNTNLISISTAYDKMSLFDMSANDFLGDLTYPITLGAMFEAICALVGVDYETSTFTNSTHEVDAAYVEEGTEVTARDILRWIAEAACSFARMTRDGKVELGWFGKTMTIPATGDDGINSYFADNNYGASTGFLVGYDSGGPQKKRALISFNMDEVPSGAEIMYARLHMRQNPSISSDDPIVFDIYRVTGSWSEDTVTWNTQPTVEESPTITGLNCPKATENTWRSWDITALVTEMIAESTDSIMLRLQDESGDYREQGFWSFDSSISDPYIEIRYKTMSANIPKPFKTDIADYEVSQIDMLEILSSDTSTNATVGTGFNSYVIVNNPFLHGATSVEVAEYCEPIYTKLAAFPAFYPMAVTAVCDWSIQAGDIVTVTIDGTEYSLPIYVQTIVWRGDARVTYESTGSATRGPVDSMLRELFRVQAASEGSVRQGVMYNNVYVSHAEGFVAQATINGEEVTARFNAGELGFYNSSGELIGGMAVEGGIMAMIAGILTNHVGGNCYAKVGNVTSGGYVYQGISIYRKDYSTSNPLLNIVSYSDGTMAFGGDGRGYLSIDADGVLRYRDANNVTRLSLGSGGGIAIYDDDGILRIISEQEGNFYIFDKNRNRLALTDTNSILYSPNGAHYIGVNDSGPFSY